MEGYRSFPLVSNALPSLGLRVQVRVLFADVCWVTGLQGPKGRTSKVPAGLHITKYEGAATDKEVPGLSPPAKMSHFSQERGVPGHPLCRC